MTDTIPTCRHCRREIPPRPDGSPGWYRVVEGGGRRKWFCSDECFAEVEAYLFEGVDDKEREGKSE